MFDDEEKEGREGGGFLTGLMIGAAVGAVVALLFAPASGEETRRLVRKRARAIEKKAASAWVAERDAARHAIRRRRKQLRDKLEAAASRADEVLEDVKDRLRG
ncbi:MAG TPA: YtxH domain-containing protein [Gemmatimonadales bacterium]|nr:YtxH domain-containing protein [Gemmatimonadales bacterium]